MALGFCSSTCNPVFYPVLGGNCQEKFRDETIKAIIAVNCKSDPLFTYVFDNADGGAGDAALLTLINNALLGFATAYVIPVASFEPQEPEATERVYSTCDMPIIQYHSQIIRFTSVRAIDTADTTGISAPMAIGRHKVGTLYNIEQRNLAHLMAEKHVYYAVTCDGKIYMLGQDTGDTALPAIAAVTNSYNQDNPRSQYVVSQVDIRFSKWITDPKLWTPVAIANSVTLAGLTALKEQLGL